jgi:hypothetical protein
MLRWIFTTVTVFAAVAIAAPDAAAQDNPLGSCRRETRVQREGLTVEKIEGRPDANRFILTGSVAIICDDTSLFADEVIYETDTKKIFAKGSVTFRQLDLQIFADRADLDGATKLGTFFNAAGSTRLGDMPQQRSAFGTQEADVMFRGETIARTGPQHLPDHQWRLHHLRAADAALGDVRHQRVDHARRARGDEKRRAARQERAARLPADHLLPDQQGRQVDRFPAAVLGLDDLPGVPAQQRVLLGDRSAARTRPSSTTTFRKPAWDTAANTATPRRRDRRAADRPMSSPKKISTPTTA